MTPLVVREGRILAYRLLDVADEIDLAAAQARASVQRASRGSLTREGAKSLVLSAPPVEVPLGRKTVELPRAGRSLEAEVTARLFDYGAASFAFDIPIPAGSRLEDLVPLCDEIYDSPDLDRLARESARALTAHLGDAIHGAHEWDGIETYTVVYVRRLDGDPAARDVLDSPALAGLVLGEPGGKRLSSDQREDVLKHAHSYFDDDLAVIDWNSAFVLEPSGSRDIPDILELATSQLLELRYYDKLFDAAVQRVYRELERAKSAGLWALVRNPWAEISRRLVRRFVELSEFAERVDNALKVIGDFYLARVYESAVRRFRIRAWQASIDAKQDLLGRAHGLIRGEFESLRSTMLELVIIALIVLEVVLAVIR